MTEWNIPEIYQIPSQHKEILEMLLDKVARVLEKEKIVYFIDGGTLLGAVRHEGLIPYDDDIDIGVFHNDFEELAHILYTKMGKDGQHEIRIEVTTPELIKVYVEGLWCKNNDTGALIATPTLDIFKWEKHNDQIRLCLGDRRLFKNCFYLKKEFYPLQDYKFGNLIVKGSNDPQKYLHRYYGADCLDVCRIDVRIEGGGLSKDRESICFERVNVRGLHN